MSKRIIEVVDFNLNWNNIFELEKKQLTKVIGINAVDIEHIGSTAVAGLAAKPIIDILIEVTSLKALDMTNKSMETLGYRIKGENGIAGRRYYQKGGNMRSHHVHAFQIGDGHLHRHRAFKAYLIAHAEIAAEYGSLKKAASTKSNNDINIYIALKNDFIQKHEALAIEWFGR